MREATEVRAQPESKEELKALVETAASIEKLRIAMSNRLSALERGVDGSESPTPTVYAELFSRVDGMEALIDSAVGAAVKEVPIYGAWLCHVRGIGPALAAQMLAFLLPPREGMGVGTWFKAAGLSPEWREDQGQWRLPRARAGEGKTRHHRYLRRCLHNVGTSLVRTGGFYRAFYDRAKARLVEVHAGDKEWPAHRLDDTARWVTVKLLLSHLWAKWAESDGVTVRPPYVIDVLGHQGYIPPPEWDGQNKI